METGKTIEVGWGANRSGGLDNINHGWFLVVWIKSERAYSIPHKQQGCVSLINA